LSAISAASAGIPKLDDDAWSIYKRLLRYARPYVGVFLIGVLGMILFAATNIGLAYVVKQFVSGAFVKRDPQVLWQVPIAVVVLFTLTFRVETSLPMPEPYCYARSTKTSA